MSQKLMMPPYKLPIDNTVPLTPKSPKKKVLIEEPTTAGEKQQYKQLLTANLNLVDIVNTGGNLFFDCPPICFNEEK